MSTALVVLVVVLACAAGVAWLVRRAKAAGAAAVVRTESSAKETTADVVAVKTEVVEVKAADAQLASEKKAGTLAFVNKRFGAGPKVLLLGALLGSARARADCTCEQTPAGDCAGPVTCDAATFNALAAGDEQAEHDRDVCAAGAKKLGAELDAARVHVKALEAAPEPDPTPLLWGLGGLGVGVVLTLVAVLAGGHH